ncbi:MAG: helix-turn-helix domain-containing protein [Candidatus Obscuribacterales bacterium]|nr:helix-turn-helix domain-containing protein [Candidatus Obscuribacterales bacterium]
MSDTARDYQMLQPATTEGLEEFFDVECQGETIVTPCELPGVTGDFQDEAEGYTLAEAARKLGVPYTTFYKQVKAGKHHTVSGADGKQRVILKTNHGDTPGVTPVSPPSQEVTLGVFQSSEGVTEAYHLKIIEQLSAKLEGANYRIGWLESQLQEREHDVEELKLLTDSQHKSGKWQRFRSWFFGQ